MFALLNLNPETPVFGQPVCHEQVPAGALRWYHLDTFLSLIQSLLLSMLPLMRWSPDYRPTISPGRACSTISCLIWSVWHSPFIYPKVADDVVWEEKNQREVCFIHVIRVTRDKREDKCFTAWGEVSIVCWLTGRSHVQTGATRGSWVNSARLVGFWGVYHQTQQKLQDHCELLNCSFSHWKLREPIAGWLWTSSTRSWCSELWSSCSRLSILIYRKWRPTSLYTADAHITLL